MRELTSHKVTGVNDGLKIVVRDEESPLSSANHNYTVEWTQKNGQGQVYAITFQNGTLPEVGVNGLTHEALLAILIDRLEGFQRGKFACKANEIALNHLRDAQGVLLMRTQERVSRGVEGTHQV